MDKVDKEHRKEIMEKAIERAKANGRRTIQAHDL